MKCDGCGRNAGALHWAGGVELCRQCHEKWQVVVRLADEVKEEAGEAHLHRRPIHR